MQILNVEIKNFRGIEQQIIHFKPGINLIKGINGTGKTSILEAIAVGLGGFVAGIPEVATRHFSSDEVRVLYEKVGDGSFNKSYKMPLTVAITAVIDDKKYEWIRGKSSINAARSTTQPRDICKLAEKMAGDKQAELPLLVYLSAGRVWSQKKEKSENVFRKPFFRTAGYIDALYEASNIKLLLNWCVKMEQIAWQKEQRIAEYEAVKKAVAGFMDNMEGAEGHEVFYDKQEEQLMYRMEEEIHPINQLSAGYQSLIWMAFDIAYRMAVLNPEKKQDIVQTKGVALIDELDMHLHPKWQWNVVPALRKTFPNVQFIVATHAPILFASSDDLWLIDIEGDEVQYARSRSGYDANTILETYMGVKSINGETDSLIHSIYAAIDKKQYEKADKRIRRLIEMTSENYSEVITAQMELMRRHKE